MMRMTMRFVNISSRRDMIAVDRWHRSIRKDQGWIKGRKRITRRHQSDGRDSGFMLLAIEMRTKIDVAETLDLAVMTIKGGEGATGGSREATDEEIMLFRIRRTMLMMMSMRMSMMMRMRVRVRVSMRVRMRMRML